MSGTGSTCSGQQYCGYASLVLNIATWQELSPRPHRSGIVGHCVAVSPLAGPVVMHRLALGAETEVRSRLEMRSSGCG